MSRRQQRGDSVLQSVSNVAPPGPGSVHGCKGLPEDGAVSKRRGGMTDQGHG